MSNVWDDVPDWGRSARIAPTGAPNASWALTEYPDTGKVGFVVADELRVHRSAEAVEHAGPD
jgi:hypothetical protein